MAGSHGAEAARAAWLELRLALRDSLLRLRELRAHALDETRLLAVAARLSGGGRLHIGTLRDGQHLMGWTLHGSPVPD
jgi:hypothetical protein